MSFSGVIYDTAQSNTDPHYQLSQEQLEYLPSVLIGVPIKFEHADRQGDKLTFFKNADNVETNFYGKVVSAHFDGQKLKAEWQLNDGHTGWIAERFIESGRTPELSLRSWNWRDGRIKPTELSLVQKGARPGCVIDSSAYKSSQDLQVNQGPVLVMASASVPDVAVAAVAPTPVAVAPAAITQEQIASAEDTLKRARDESGRFTGGAIAQTQEDPSKRLKVDHADPAAFIQAMSSRVDEGALQEVADFIAKQMEANVNNLQEIKALSAAKAALEQAQQANVASSKNVVRDIVDTLNAIYQSYAGTSMGDSQKAKLNTLFSGDVEALEAMRPILVSASAIHQRAGAAAVQVTNKVAEAQVARIQQLQRQVDSARNMTVAQQPSAPMVQPAWQPAGVPIDVAASAQNAQAAPVQQPYKFRMPDILKMQSYSDAGGVGRVTRGDFERKV